VGADGVVAERVGTMPKLYWKIGVSARDTRQKS